jgi:hypothetical protein
MDFRKSHVKCKTNAISNMDRVDLYKREKKEKKKRGLPNVVFISRKL